MLKKLVVALVVLMAFSVLVVACGGGDETTTTTAVTGSTGSTETTAPAVTTTAGAASSTTAPAAAALTIRLQGAFPEGGAHYYYFDTFCQSVAKYSNGTLNVVWGAGPEAIPANELPEAIKNDAVELVFAPYSYLVSFAPVLQAVKLMDPASTRANGGMAYLNEVSEQSLNAHFLGRASDGVSFVVAMNKKIDTLADFKGTTVRASAALSPLLSALGAGVVSMPLGDIYDALQRNVVGGAGLVLTDITDNSLQEVLKYLIQPGIYLSDSSLLIAMGTWNKLDDVQKAALSKASEDWEVDSKIHNTAIAADVMKTITAAGMQVIELQGAERDAWLKTASDVVWAEAEKADPTVAAKLKSFVQ